jgi:hypothetical protein
MLYFGIQVKKGKLDSNEVETDETPLPGSYSHLRIMKFTK